LQERYCGLQRAGLRLLDPMEGDLKCGGESEWTTASHNEALAS